MQIGVKNGRVNESRRVNLINRNRRTSKNNRDRRVGRADRWEKITTIVRVRRVGKVNKVCRVAKTRKKNNKFVTTNKTKVWKAELTEIKIAKIVQTTQEKYQGRLTRNIVRSLSIWASIKFNYAKL